MIRQLLELTWAEDTDPKARERIVSEATDSMLAHFLMYGLVGITIHPPNSFPDERKEEPSPRISEV